MAQRDAPPHPGQTDLGAFPPPPLIETPPVNSADRRYMIQFRDYYRTSSAAYQAYLAAQSSQDWFVTTRSGYLAGLPYGS